MPRRIDVFYAYPSRPSSVGDTIQNAARFLNQNKELKDQNVRIRPWPTMDVPGRSLIGQIAQAIDRAGVFASDVTYLNSNVAFELGYAVARFKRLWISLDPSISGAKLRFVHEYTGMLGVGYSEYENHGVLSQAFIDSAPWKTLDEYVLNMRYRAKFPRPSEATLLYIKPPTATDSVIRTLEHLTNSIFKQGLIVDEPKDVGAPGLDWYADKIATADAVLVHLESDDRVTAEHHNAKASFLAGLAHGMRQPLLMLSHEPFACPTDYQLLHKTHSSASECETELATWIESLQIARRRPRLSDRNQARAATNLELRNLTVGEYVAEHEDQSLDDYFYETSAYAQALDAQVSIMVGRRGTGKSANLIAMHAALSRSMENHVCVIKPVGYEIDGLIRLSKEDWHSAERGHLLESLWKYLIYSELSRSVVEELDARPAQVQLSDAEQRLKEYVEANADVLLAPFSQRVDRAVGSLEGVVLLGDRELQRSKISEVFHATRLSRLRVLLGEALTAKSKVAILIDNLDDPWRPGDDSTVLADFLLGLLREIQSLAEDFGHNDSRRKEIRSSITVFIRSDIFVYLQPLAREQDKWPLRKIEWNDSETLLRVIEQRLLHLAPVKATADDVWTKVMPEEVVGVSAKEFITSNTLKRPRDVIFLVKRALARAVDRGHSRITAEDCLDARNDYSRWVFDSIVLEDDLTRGLLQNVLFEFAGATHFVTEDDVRARILRAGADEQSLEFYLNLLCDVNFLGIRTTTGYRFVSDEAERRSTLEIARHLRVELGWPDLTFEINSAFHHNLQIDT